MRRSQRMASLAVGVKPPSVVETRLIDQLHDANLNEGCYREHQFHPTRRWRFDLAWPELYFAVEVEGGIYRSGNHHVFGPQIENDCEKISEAVALGWCVIRVTDKMIRSGLAVDLIARCLVRRAAAAPHPPIPIGD